MSKSIATFLACFAVWSFAVAQTSLIPEKSASPALGEACRLEIATGCPDLMCQGEDDRNLVT